MRNFIFILFLFSITLHSQEIYSEKDIEVCTSKYTLAIDSEIAKKPIGDVIAAIGRSFIGTDYEASTLDKPAEEAEPLIINLTGLDCYTFLESALVFGRTIKSNNFGFDAYKKELVNIRYRDGKRTDYISRLHYFTDWIFDMQKRGIVKDITKEIGGIRYKKEIDFMSSNPKSYKQLRENPTLVKRIKKIENEINKREYYYIPEGNLAELESNINEGDLISITTNSKGLDVSHVGIAVRNDDGRIHLLHSPNVGYKIQITEKPLADYLEGNKKQTGIIVVRPL
ncbi:MAG: DUF1460 domain-containing protein [Ignavibacteriaceae bacterium]|nr:DUF1460 domain-containing protein [Ignavibacteriaceae bacterium]